MCFFVHATSGADSDQTSEDANDIAGNTVFSAKRSIRLLLEGKNGVKELDLMRKGVRFTRKGVRFIFVQEYGAFAALGLKTSRKTNLTPFL